MSRCVWHYKMNDGPRTAAAGVVGEYCSVPGLIFAVITFPGLRFPGLSFPGETSRVVNYLPPLLLSLPRVDVR